IEGNGFLTVTQWLPVEYGKMEKCVENDQKK
ncbi:MAG: hypothetical protein RL086_1016, partial [Bacteroidota bacterium]